LPGDKDKAQGIHFVAKGHDESRNAVGVNFQSSHQFARSIILKSAEQIQILTYVLKGRYLMIQNMAIAAIDIDATQEVRIF